MTLDDDRIRPDDDGAEPSLVDQLGAELVSVRQDLRILTRKLERTEDTALRAVQGLDDLEETLSSTADAIESAARLRADDLSPADANGATKDTEPDDKPEPLDMDVLQAWVLANIGEWAQRKIPATPNGDGIRWCARWFEHPEAITRFWALHRAWKEFVGQPGAAMVVYFRDYLDPTMNAVSCPNGPFHACTPAQHSSRTGFMPIAEAPWRTTTSTFPATG